MTKANRHQIAQAINGLINKKLPSARIATAIASYTIATRCTRELDGIMREVSRLRAEQGICEATITSVRDLSVDVKEKLEKIVANNNPTAKKIVSHTVVDPSIVGGVKLETDDLRLDMTIRNRLSYLTSKA